MLSHDPALKRSMQIHKRFVNGHHEPQKQSELHPGPEDERAGEAFHFKGVCSVGWLNYEFDNMVLQFTAYYSNVYIRFPFYAILDIDKQEY